MASGKEKVAKQEKNLFHLLWKILKGRFKPFLKDEEVITFTVFDVSSWSTTSDAEKIQIKDVK